MSIVPFVPPLDSRRLTATAVQEFETANGPADYAVCSGGEILGVVEAKRLAAVDQGAGPAAAKAVATDLSLESVG